MLKELRNTLPLAYPLILANISQMGLGLIDSAMVGAIDYYLLAASSLAVNAIAIPHVIGSGLTVAIAPLVAFAHGRARPTQVSTLLYNGIWLSAFAGLMLAITIHLIAPLLGYLKQDPKVAELAIPYFRIMGWSLFPLMIFFALKNFSDGLSFTKTGMVLSFMALPVNAFLDWIFIYGKWGMPALLLDGAGWATLITRVLQAIVMAIVIFRHRLFKPYIDLRKKAWHLRKKIWNELLQIGIPSSMQYTMESAAFSISGIMIGWLGASTQAAHQIALNCASLTFMASVGISQAASIRISHAFGQKNYLLLRQIGTSTIVGGISYGIICALGFILFRNQLPILFNNDPGVLAMAAGLLIYGAIFQISDATQAIGVGLLRGIKDVKKPTLYVALAYWVIGIPFGYLLAFRWHWGAAGIWLGFVAGLTASSILLNIRFLKKSIPPAVTDPAML